MWFTESLLLCKQCINGWLGVIYEESSSILWCQRHTQRERDKILLVTTSKVLWIGNIGQSVTAKAMSNNLKAIRKSKSHQTYNIKEIRAIINYDWFGDSVTNSHVTNKRDVFCNISSFVQHIQNGCRMR